MMTTNGEISQNNVEHSEAGPPLLLPFDGDSQSQKRKANENDEEPSATPLKAKKVIDKCSQLQIDLLEQILTRINHLEGIDQRLERLESSVDTIKNEILLREPQMDIDQKLDSIVQNINNLKQNLTKDHTDGDNELSTQQALEAIANSPMDIAIGDNNTDSFPNGSAKEWIPDWEEYLKRRKLCYNKYLTNKGRYDIHDNWKSQNPPFIPALYLPKQLKFDESDREYHLRRCQKLHELDTFLELLAVRRDEALVQYTSVDSHIEQTINSLLVNDNIKEALKGEYRNSINKSEQECAKKWENASKGLKEKQTREHTNGKIITVGDRTYAKGKSKKPKANKTPNITPKETPKVDPPSTSLPQQPNPVKNVSVAENKNEWKVKRHNNRKKWNNNPGHSNWGGNYVQHCQHALHPSPVHSCPTPSHQNFHYPVIHHSLSQPPPAFTPSSLATTQTSHSFPLANQQNQWTHLSPNVRI